LVSSTLSIVLSSIGAASILGGDDRVTRER
jgi:hypothetical protein